MTGTNPLLPSFRPSALPPLIYFAAGGTGGHVYPALAAAEALAGRLPGAEIRFIGTAERLEGRLVPAAGYQLVPIRLQGLPRRLNWRLFKTLGQLGVAALGLLQEFRRRRPALVVGFGGYASAPALLAARLLGVPTVLHEQNAVAGLTNRLLGRWASRVAVSFADTTAAFPGGRAVVTGNPVRPALRGDRAAARRTLGLGPADRVLLVFGGSLGARSLNRALLPLLDRILAVPGWQVYHVCGETDWTQCREQAAAWAGESRYTLVPYCEDLPPRLLAADLAITRAGATTVAEAIAARLPCVLVPYPHAHADEQLANARPLAAAGAALLLPDHELADRLWAVIEPLLGDAAGLTAMRERLAGLAPEPPAAERLAGLLESLLELGNDRGNQLKQQEMTPLRGETQPCSP